MCGGSVYLNWYDGSSGGDDDGPSADAASSGAKDYELAPLTDRETALVPTSLRIRLPAKVVTGFKSESHSHAASRLAVRTRKDQHNACALCS